MDCAGLLLARDLLFPLIPEPILPFRPKAVFLSSYGTHRSSGLESLTIARAVETSRWFQETDLRVVDFQKKNVPGEKEIA